MLRAIRLDTLSALEATIDDVGGDSEVIQSIAFLHSCIDVTWAWLEESSDDVVHAWLWTLWSHVEP